MDLEERSNRLIKAFSSLQIEIANHQSDDSFFDPETEVSLVDLSDVLQDLRRRIETWEPSTPE
jgi:hypothetical protein